MDLLLAGFVLGILTTSMWSRVLPPKK